MNKQNKGVVDILAFKEQQPDIVDSEKILLILVRQMIPPDATLVETLHIIMLHDLLKNFPQADQKERLMSATAIATWVMMIDLSHRR